MRDDPTGQLLWQHVLESPDEVARLAVFGDHLQSTGHVRGPLVALHLADDDPEVREALRQYVFEHRDALLGPLCGTESPVRVVWGGGFVQELELVVRGFGEEEAQWFRELRELGALGLLRRLRLVGTANYDQVVTELIRHEWPLLTSLHLGPLNLGAGRLDVPLADVLAAFPALVDLRVEFPGSFSGLASSTLERLTMSLHAEQLPSLDLVGLTALRSVELLSREDPDGRVLDGALSRPLDEVGLHGALIDTWLYSSALPAPKIFRLHGASKAQRDAVLRRVASSGTEVVAAPRPDANTDALLTPPEQRRVRRFVRAGRFWEIRRAFARLEFRFGKYGRPGTKRHTDFQNAYQASRSYQERVAKKRGEGFKEVWVPTER